MASTRPTNTLRVRHQAERGRPDNRRGARLCWTLSALPSTALILYLLVVGELTLVTTGAYLLVVLLGWGGLTIMEARIWPVRLTLVLGSLNLFLVTPELALRAAGYEATSTVCYGALRPECRAYFEADSDLMWKYRQGQPGVNSLGFRGREIETSQPVRKRRLLIIGDSCADQNYASLLEQMLNNGRLSGQGEFECVVLAVPGYSSYQGRVIAEKYARLVKADLAFVCFGWNDHWLAYGATDAEMGDGLLSPLVRSLYSHSRVLQLAVESARSGNRPPESIVDRLRVPPGQFRNNLAAIDRALADAGTSTVFITAPTCHQTCGVPPYLVERKWAIDSMAVLVLHRHYAKIVREVAATTDAGLLDLESRFNESEQRHDLFKTDGIHFTQAGLQEVASDMYQYLLDSRTLETTKYDPS